MKRFGLSTLTLIDNNDVYMHTTSWFKEEKFGKILNKIQKEKYEWKVGILWKELHGHKLYFDSREGEKSVLIYICCNGQTYDRMKDK